MVAIVKYLKVSPIILIIIDVDCNQQQATNVNQTQEEQIETNQAVQNNQQATVTTNEHFSNNFFAGTE